MLEFACLSTWIGITILPSAQVEDGSMMLLAWQRQSSPDLPSDFDFWESW
jgi:hypothetical protein